MDSLDLKILKALQSSARKKNVELARDLGVAPSTMLERVRSLEERGLILGYRAMLNPEMLDLNVQAFISVALDRHESDVIRQFEEGIRNMPCVRACYHLAGRFDYLLHVAVHDLKQLGQLVKTGFASLPAFGKSETFLVFSEVKPDIGLPIDVDDDLLGEP